MATQSLYSYDANTTTPQQLARKRELIRAMMTGQKTPTNWGEGVGAILTGLARGAESRQLDQQEAAGLGTVAGDMEAVRNGYSQAFPAAPNGGSPVADADSLGGAPGASVDLSGDNETFVSSLMPAAMEASRRTGVDPRIIVAQAAQETGWGKHAPGNNYFGIKSHGQGGGQNFATTEYVNGKPVRVNDSFRGYASPADSVAGYADFLLKNPRYKPMMGAQGMDAQLAALGASGYATDPNYAQSVGAIARGLPAPAMAANDAMTSGQPIPPGPQQVASLDQSVGLPQTAPAPPAPRTIQDMPVAEAPQQVAQDLSQIPPMAGGTAGAIPPDQQSGPSMEVLMKAASNPWLMADPSRASMINMLLKQKLAEQDPSNQLNTEYRRAQIANLKAQTERENNPLAQNKFGLQPQYGVDANGDSVILQLGNNGVATQTALPEGVTLSKEPIKLDAGTEWVLLDPITRQPVGTIPKNIAEAEAEKKRGQAQGEAQFDLPRVEQNAEQTLGILERMKDHPGRSGSTGFIQGMLPSRTSDQVDFQSLVDQTQGQSFLQAFQMLKGAGQITEIEGQKATDAISRLRNQRLSDADYLKAISDLEDVVKKGLARAKVQAGQTAPSAPAGGGNRTRSGVSWSVEP